MAEHRSEAPHAGHIPWNAGPEVVLPHVSVRVGHLLYILYVTGDPNSTTLYTAAFYSWDWISWHWNTDSYVSPVFGIPPQSASGQGHTLVTPHTTTDTLHMLSVDRCSSVSRRSLLLFQDDVSDTWTGSGQMATLISTFAPDCWGLETMLAASENTNLNEFYSHVDQISHPRDHTSTI